MQYTKNASHLGHNKDIQKVGYLPTIYFHKHAFEMNENVIQWKLSRKVT